MFNFYIYNNTLPNGLKTDIKTSSMWLPKRLQ